MLLGVDVGGTFTDAVLVGEDATLFTAKVPSTPAEESEGVLQAVRLVLARAGAGADSLERFAHGMTVATNALLEGRTARTALIATEGFTDVIELARQNRPHLYELCRARPAPLVPAELRFGAPERVGPDGVLVALDHTSARELVERIAAAEPEAVAISLLHAYRDPAHERLLGALVAELMPEAGLSLSGELVGTFREYERSATTVLDAALSPLLRTYLSRLTREAVEAGLPEPLVMQSSGGLTEASRAGAPAALTVLSGPAGGVAGASMLAQLAGEREVLCFDMGGTSCDVCVIEDGEVGETGERDVAGRPLSLPALDIHTVGAGGGSIASRDAGGALRVGPASAGAHPGPACYGRGGTEPTVTDANLLLGRLPLDAPLAGTLALDRAAAEDALEPLARELGLDVLACAEGIVSVAEAEMLGALRLMSVERGIDPRGFALMPFGGAGPLHAASLAEQMGIGRILCPRTSGVLSALGLAAAPPRRDVARSLLLAGERLSAAAVEREREDLLGRAHAALGTHAARVRLRYELRYRGQSFELPVEEELAPSEAGGLDPDGLRAAFAREHELRYGFSDAHAEIELVTMRASAWARAPRPSLRAQGTPAPSVRDGRVRFAGAWLTTSICYGEPAPGTAVAGPALIALRDATVLVPPGWSGAVDEHGTIRLARGAR